MTARTFPAFPLVPVVLIAGAWLFVASSPDAAAFPNAPATSASLSHLPTAGGDEIVWSEVPGPGKKCLIDDDYYFEYEFSEKPKMGLVVLKIQIFDKDKNQVVPFKAVGRSDMPSMRGAHDSGDQEFKVNKFNNYLLPVNVVMPGDWEIKIVFLSNDKAVFHGIIRFDV